MFDPGLVAGLAEQPLKEVAPAWNGAPRVLQDMQFVNMQQTPVGSMIFAYENQSPGNSAGKLSLVSGGVKGPMLDAPAGTGSPSFLHKNWGGNNLQVANFSIVTVPIRIQAVGPGIPGNNPSPLVVGTPLDLAPGASAEGLLNPTLMQLAFKTAKYTATFALVGGPPDGTGQNAYTFTVAGVTNTPVTPGQPPSPGDYSTTAKTYEFTMNWGSARIFVANLSGVTSKDNSVVLSEVG